MIAASSLGTGASLRRALLALVCCIGVAALATWITVWSAGVADSLWVEGKDLAWVVTALVAAYAVAVVVVGFASQEWGLWLLLAGYPLTNRTIEWLYVLNGPALLNVFNALLLYLTVRALTSSRRARLTTPDWWLITFAASALVPNALAADKMLAARGFLQTIGEPLMVYYLIRTTYPERHQLPRLLGAVTAFLLFHWAFIVTEGVRAGSPRDLVYARVEGGFAVAGGLRVFSGGLGEPIQAAWIVLLFLPLYQTLGATRARLRWWLVGLGILVETFIGLSRYPLVYLILEHCLLLLVAKRFQLPGVMRSLMATGVVAAITALPLLPLLVARFGDAPNAGRVADSAILGGRVLDVDSVIYLSAAVASADLSLHQPLGIGYENGNDFREYFDRYVTLRYINMSNVGTIAPHISLAVQAGWITAATFIGFLVTLARRCGITVRTSDDDLVRRVAAGALVTVVGMGVLLGRMDLVPGGGYLRDGSIDRSGFPSSQQVVWSFVLLGIASTISAYPVDGDATGSKPLAGKSRKDNSVQFTRQASPGAIRGDE